jgi:hypothetical protein
VEEESRSENAGEEGELGFEEEDAIESRWKLISSKGIGDFRFLFLATDTGIDTLDDAADDSARLEEGREGDNMVAVDVGKGTALW